LDQIFQGLAEIELPVEHLEMDHLCYRVESLERYYEIKRDLEQEHRVLGESEIGGRPIVNFLLARPLSYGNRLIKVLELPAPKPTSSYKEGYEHVEFVTNQSLEAFIAKHQHIKFDLSGLGKKRNREVRLSLGSVNVKFHEESLLKIIKEEQQDITNL